MTTAATWATSKEQQRALAAAVGALRHHGGTGVSHAVAPHIATAPLAPPVPDYVARAVARATHDDAASDLSSLSDLEDGDPPPSNLPDPPAVLITLRPAARGSPGPMGGSSTSTLSSLSSASDRGRETPSPPPAMSAAIAAIRRALPLVRGNGLTGSPGNRLTRSIAETKNQDFCDHCGGHGSLLCCESCPRAFHQLCLDPPMDYGDAPDGAWYCRECAVKIGWSDAFCPATAFLPSDLLLEARPGPGLDLMHKPTVIESIPQPIVTLFEVSTPSAVAKAAAAVPRSQTSPASSISSLSSSLSSVEGRVWWPRFHAYPTKTTPACPKARTVRAAFTTMLFDVERRNPEIFQLPPAVLSAFDGVIADDDGDFALAGFIRSSKKKSGKHEPRELVRLATPGAPVPLCYACGGSALRGQFLLQCDFCPLNWHLDCIVPDPLCHPPRPEIAWMCPCHADHDLPRLRAARDRHIAYTAHGLVRIPRNVQDGDEALPPLNFLVRARQDRERAAERSMIEAAAWALCEARVSRPCVSNGVISGRAAKPHRRKEKLYLNSHKASSS